MAVSRGRHASGGRKGQDAHPAGIKNLGPVSMQWLAEVGIHSREQLLAVGAVEAYRRVKRLYPKGVNRIFLVAMQAGLMGLHWQDVSPEMKAALYEELAEAERRETLGSGQ